MKEYAKGSEKFWLSDEHGSAGYKSSHIRISVEVKERLTELRQEFQKRYKYHISYSDAIALLMDENCEAIKTKKIHKEVHSLLNSV